MMTNTMKTATTAALVAMVMVATTAWTPAAWAEEAGSASAKKADEDKPPYETGGIAGTGLVVGLKVGGGFSQPFSDLESSFVGELELGYIIPAIDNALQIFLSGQYSAPTAEGTAEPDARLPGDGIMSYEVTQRQAIISLGLLYRIPLDSSLFRPYLGVGGRVYLHQTEVTGSAGDEPFGENIETATDYGVIAMVGGEIYVGPGAVLLEVQVGWSELDGYIMRDTNTGALNVAAGYRVFF